MFHLHDFHHVQVDWFIGFRDGEHSIYYSLEMEQLDQDSYRNNGLKWCISF